MKTAFIYSDIYLKHNRNDHPEYKGRLEAIIEHLQSSDIKDVLIHEKPRRAKIEEIASVHDTQYIQEIKEFCDSGGGFLDPDTYTNTYTYETALHAVGGILRAVEIVSENEVKAVFCAVRPPGHHAEYSRAMGFCIFNNIAIGAKFAQNQGYNKVFIIDFDAHHGNGTQRSFYEDDTIFFFSTHQYPFYPGTGSSEEKGAGKGEGYTLNIPMEAFSGDKEFEKVYKEILPKEIDDFKPSIILVSAGYDLHKEDPLAQLQVTDGGIKSIVESIVYISKELNVPIIFTLEGGYNIEALGRNVVSTLRICLEC